MSSAYGPEGLGRPESKHTSVASWPTLECHLFESLVHHLIEKGVLTRNDALSVVATVAQVKREALEERQPGAAAEKELAILELLYSSFQLVHDRPFTSQALDDENVLQLRPPIHVDRPESTQDD